MSLLVFDHVVGADEAVAAVLALKLLLAGVGAAVTRELVRPGEPAVAVLHGALVRLLT